MIKTTGYLKVRSLKMWIFGSTNGIFKFHGQCLLFWYTLYQTFCSFIRKGAVPGYPVGNIVLKSETVGTMVKFLQNVSISHHDTQVWSDVVICTPKSNCLFCSKTSAAPFQHLNFAQKNIEL